MRQSRRDEAKGKYHEAKGTVKAKVGRTLNRPDVEDEGLAEKTSGKVQKTAGRIERAAKR
jgi:uncharacterized protein YjbJ (UPF0337 family)